MDLGLITLYFLFSYPACADIKLVLFSEMPVVYGDFIWMDEYEKLCGFRIFFLFCYRF